MTFLRFLACVFYWLRLELAALERPTLPCAVTRERGRWRATFGESIGEGREAWLAVRALLEGTPETEPLELEPEALESAAVKLAHELEERRAAELAAELEARTLAGTLEVAP